MKTDNRRIRNEEIARDIRKNIVRMHAAAKTSHIGSSFSCVEILVALYFEVLHIDPHQPGYELRDRFILSKGHAVSSLYATLARRDFFEESLLKEYCRDASCMSGHASLGSVPGIEVSTGSLGHGLPIGTGMALAGKRDMKDYRVFVLMSDGECDEGSNWEAALFASHHKLDNLVVIIDRNRMQALGATTDVLNTEPLAAKWKAFGWQVRGVNGHDIQKIADLLKRAPFSKGKPSVIIADTTKGKGVSFMENELAWHYRSPGEEELKAALKELNQ